MIKNIIYFSPKSNVPNGGVKVIHRHCEIINSLGFKSEVYYHVDSGNEIKWFTHNVPIKRDLSLSKDTDLAILPESLIFDFWKQLKANEIEYGIFVQNGYLIHNNISAPDLWDCYDAAKYIICISEDAINCISNFFPDQVNKIIRVTYSVDTDLFKNGAKDKLISYMPRKKKEHSELLINLLRKHLPIEWRIIPIDNLSELDVANILSRSIIFLAFSDFEGLPVPPVEAALSGNFVIGYTGNGGREYWNLPIFEEIENGDIVHFFKSVLQRVSQIESLGHDATNYRTTHLCNMFSRENEVNMIKEMLKMICK